MLFLLPILETSCPTNLDLVLADEDEYVFSESVTSIPDVATSESKTSVSKPKESVKEIDSPSSKRNFVPRAILMKYGLKTLNTVRQNSSRAAVSVNTARPINTAYPKPTVNCARPTSNVFNRAYSHVRRPFNMFTSNKNNNFNEKVNNVKGNVTTVRPKAVVSDEANAVKASAWQSTARIAGKMSTKENIDAGQTGKKIVPDQKYILLPLLTSYPSLSKSSKDSPDAGFKHPGRRKRWMLNIKWNEDRRVHFYIKVPRVNQEHDESCNTPKISTSNQKNDKSVIGTMVIQALTDLSWIEAMHDEFLQFKLQKARLVAQGYTQEDGIDYDEVFAPVARIEAIRLFFWPYVSFMNFIFYQMDVESAFLYGIIEEEKKDYRQDFVFKKDKDDAQEIPDEFYGGAHFLLMVAEIQHLTWRLFMDSDYVVLVRTRIPQQKVVNLLGRRWYGSKSIASIMDSNYETVIKEWEDRMERDATTTSSLEAEQDSGNINRTQPMAKLNESFPHGTGSDSGPRSQDTILGYSNGFKGIIDFLNASSIKYALTVNPTVYESCIKQFWATAKAKTVNEERQIQALVDKKKVIITEKSVRSDLMLEDAEGTECLPNDVIFEQLTLMGAKTTAWNEFSSTMASAIILFLDKQVEGMSKHKGIYVTPSHTKKIFANMKREGKGFSGRITPLFQTMMVQALEDMGKDSASPTNSYSTPIITQPSSFKPLKKKSRRKQRKDIDPTEPIHDEATNEEPLSTPSCDPPQSGEDRMKLTELMSLCTKLQKQVLDLEEVKTAQAKEIASLKKRVKQLEHKRNAPTTTIDELTLAQTLIKIKAAKPNAITTAATTTITTRPKARGVVVQEPSEFKTTSSPSQASQLPQAKDKGKAKMV
ncbi:uncharacterized mitochondrial protein-like protein [Tanacetum coccineum]